MNYADDAPPPVSTYIVLRVLGKVSSSTNSVDWEFSGSVVVGGGGVAVRVLVALVEVMVARV